MRTSYHNHTVWSDGKATVQEMVDAAARCGLDEVGISDHFVVAPAGQHPGWAIKPGALGAYVDDVLRAAARASAPLVRLGVEVDYIAGTVDQAAEALRQLPLDYVIGSVHFLEGFPVDNEPSDWEPLSQAQVDNVWRLYWRAIRGLAASGLCDFVGHLDLPKIFGRLPQADLAVERSEALDAIAAAGIAIEINTAGWHKRIGEVYPAPDLLRACRERAIPLVINADAHHPDHLVRDGERARRMALDAGYTYVLRYEKRVSRAVEL